MYLLDTAIVFELGKVKAGRTDPGLVAWAAAVPREDLFVSAITLLELSAAAGRLERRDKPAGGAMKSWLGEQVARSFEGRILAIDAAIVRRRALLAYADSRDALIAATALEHGLTLVTRDTAAFKAGRVKLLDPWGYRADADEDSDWRQAARAGSLWLRTLFNRT